MTRQKRFRELARDWIDCERCELHPQRKNVVFARGSFGPYIVFIGEAPGAEEDVQGRPFVGRSGQLLDELIDEAGIGRGTYTIMNVLGCRPPGNREPTIFEVKACKKRFDTLIDIFNPQVLVALGRTAGKMIVGVQSISKWRGAPLEAELVINAKIRKFKSVVTYHPSYLLRSARDSDLRKSVVRDFKKAKGMVKIPIQEPEY